MRTSAEQPHTRSCLTAPTNVTAGAPISLIKGNGGAVGRWAGEHGGVADLLWDDVKCFFNPDLMGSLPEVRVPTASVEDWQAVLNLVSEKGWKCQYSEGEVVLPVPRAEAVLSRLADAECPDLRVWPTADVLAIFRFHAADEVDFDVDLRELQGQGRLDVFCGFLRDIGRRLGKPVLMDPEGDSGHPVLGFDVEADRVVVFADPQIRRSAGQDERSAAARREREEREHRQRDDRGRGGPER